MLLLKSSIYCNKYWEIFIKQIFGIETNMKLEVELGVLGMI